MANKPRTPAKILVVRNDKLGDFMLAYPSFAMLKQALPHTRIYALVPAYTREMAQLCPWIDEIIVDPGTDASANEQKQLLETVKTQNFSAVVTLFSTGRIGLLMFRAHIPQRVAPATKVAQFFYNQRLTQRRSRSEKPEYQYNIDLIAFYLRGNGYNIPALQQPPFLYFEPEYLNQLKADFCRQHNTAPSSKLIFIHPGSGGSANTLSAQQFRELANHLHATLSVVAVPAVFVITAGPNELMHAQSLRELLGELPTILYHSTSGLRAFAEHIAFADLFVSGSTGPLHIAGALDVPTAAFYTRRRSATSLRWQTLNSPEKRLAFSPPLDADECDMSRIDVASAAAYIKQKFFS